MLSMVFVFVELPLLVIDFKQEGEIDTTMTMPLLR